MMAILDSIKDPNTGKIKTPILISMVGAGGLLAYLMLSKGGSSATTTSTGQSSALTPDLTGLQTALDQLLQDQGGTPPAGTGGGTATIQNPPVTWNRLIDTPPPGSTTYTIPDYSKVRFNATTGEYVPIDTYTVPSNIPQPVPAVAAPTTWNRLTDPPPAGSTTYTVPNYQPTSQQVAGSSGSGGGGGSGTGAVIQPIAKDPTVYGGLPASG